ncbi:hypothetical protein Bca101_076225 [Brassica carinata]
MILRRPRRSGEGGVSRHVSTTVVRVKASVISVHCLIGVSSLLCLSVRLAIAISAFRCARLPLLHQYQLPVTRGSSKKMIRGRKSKALSTRVSGGVPTEMQLGLLLSYAPTFSPPEYVRRFLEPFNKAPPVPFEEVHKILQEELGRPRDSVYEYVDPTQLASASIAQELFLTKWIGVQLLMGTILGFLIKLLTLSDRLINFHSMTKNQQQEEKEEELLRIKDVKAGEEDAASSDKINEQRSRLTNLI